MNSKSIYKIPGGKLVKISLEYDENNNTISSVKITGDFFAYPEEAIETLENSLKNTEIKKEIVLKKINSLISSNNIEFIGLNAEGITEAIMRCLQ